MLSDDGKYILCDEESCDAKVPNHKWGQIKASGWYFGRLSNEARCPQHLPMWLIEWRKKRNNGPLAPSE